MSFEEVAGFLNEHDSMIVLLVMVTVFFSMTFSELDSYEKKPPINSSVENCSIEYSSVKCTDEGMVTVFHNPCEKQIKDVSMRVSNGNGGWNVYSPDAPLAPNKTNYLVTGSCGSQNQEKTRVSYCYDGSCGSEQMLNPSDDLRIKEVE